MRLKWKIIVPMSCILVLLALITTIFASIRFAGYTEILFNERISVAANGLKKYLIDCEGNSKIAALAASTDIKIISAIANRDKKEIISLLLSKMDLYHVNFVTITDEKGIVIARTHEQERYGDSILNQKNVQEAINGNTYTCIEEGTVVKLSVRTGTPVYNADGMLIGVISAGIRLDMNDTLDELKRHYNADFTVYYRSTRIAATLTKNGERLVNVPLNSDAAAHIYANKKEFFGYAVVESDHYNVFYLPLLDKQGEVFAVIGVGCSNTELFTEKHAMQVNVAAIGLLGLVFSVLILLLVTSRIIKPVTKLSHLVAATTNGNFDIDVDKSGVSQDEIGSLTLDIYSLNSVVKSLTNDLSHLTHGMNIYGDINYTIDTDKYSGVYKEIIDRIKTLADSVSMMKKAMAVMDYLDTMISVVDLDYNLLYLNKSLAAKFNINRESCMGQKCYKVLRKLDKPCPVCQLPRMLSDIASHPVIAYHAVWDEYTGIWLGGRAAAINWIDGSTVFLNSIYDETKIKDYELQLRDAITETKAALSINERQLARMNVVVNASKLGLWEVTIADNDPFNPENIYMWSDEFRQMLGYANEADFPNTLSAWYDRLHPDDRDKVIADYANHLSDKTGDTPYDTEYRLLKKNGEYSYFHTAGETARDGDGNALRIMGALKDITETKNTLLNNELQLAKLNMVVNAAKLGLWDVTIVNNDPFNPGNTFMWSDEFRHMLGYSDETDFPNTFDIWYDRLHPDDKDDAIAAINNSLSDTTGKTPFDMEYRLQKKNGEYAYYHAAGETIRDEHGDVLRVMGAFMDITETKNILAEAEKHRDAAEAANQAKSAFLANMSHEIRTPMNSIIGFSELALDAAISPITREYLARITNSAKLLLQIINDILDISKVESGNIELETIPFSLRVLLSYCKDAIMPRAVGKNIDLQFYAESSFGKILLGDPTKLRQILLNLLSNAVKFTDAGSVKLTVSIKNETKEDVTLHFEVKDSGIGMTPEQSIKILEPFAQADVSTTRKYGGTGLGIPLTKKLIELMGGKLDIESELGTGTTISFELTLSTTDIEPATSEAGNAVKELNKPTFKGEVLVCEDNRMNQRVIIDHLHRVGLNVEIAENGHEGIVKVQERFDKDMKPFDLILMDIHMPVMDGMEAASKIIQMGTGTPIVAMTANIMADDREVYKKTGMDGYVGKPFTSQELWRCLLKYFTPVSFTRSNENKKADTITDLQKQLKTDFVTNNQSRFDEIKNAMDVNDITLAHRLVHTLKSNAGLIGETALQKAAVKVEAALKGGENLVTDEEINVLRRELSSALDGLSPYLTETTGYTQPDTTVNLDAVTVRKLLKELEPLLNSGNPECLKMIDDLRGLPGSGELIRQMEDYDFDAAANTLSELKADIEKP